ncbi:MAG: HD-GYP domain-containing protein, partial [Myxococcota bacterium]
TVWAAVLGLTALLVGTLCDERASKVEELKIAYIGVVEVLSKYLQGANPRMKARSERVAELSQAVAAEMRLPQREIEDIRVGALLRDIGNMEITTKLISKAMDTLEENLGKAEKHTFLGTDLVHSLGSVLRGAVPLLVTQDEVVDDGLAAADGLWGLGTPLGARVIRAAQAYEDLVSPSAGGPKAIPREAIAQLQRDPVIRKDRDVLGALERTYGDAISTGTRPNEQIWPGGEVFVLYDVDSETGRGLAAMTSAPIHAQMRQDRSRGPGGF